ncbi:MAG: transposase, partial [Myxococcaceae bacterium]|nr:transposase [Myxococcaceae bacterium]
MTKCTLLTPRDRTRCDLKARGIPMAMGTLVSFIERAADFLAPIDRLHWQQFLASAWMATDGTGLEVLVPGLPAAHDGSIELYRNLSCAVSPHAATKASEDLEAKLKPFCGTLTAEAEHRHEDASLGLDSRGRLAPPHVQRLRRLPRVEGLGGLQQSGAATLPCRWSASRTTRPSESKSGGFLELGVHPEPALVANAPPLNHLTGYRRFSSRRQAMALGPKAMGEAIVANLKAKSGKDLAQWRAELERAGVSEPAAARQFLRERGLGRFQAVTVV